MTSKVLSNIECTLGVTTEPVRASSPGGDVAMSIIQKLLAFLFVVVAINMGAPVAEAAKPSPPPVHGCGIMVMDQGDEQAIEAYHLALAMPMEVMGYGHLADDGKPYNPYSNGYRSSLQKRECEVPWGPMNAWVFKSGCRCKGVQPKGDNDDTGRPNPFGRSGSVGSSGVAGGGSIPR